MLRPGQSRPPQPLTGLSQRLAAEFSPCDRCHLRSDLALTPVRTYTQLTGDSFTGHAIAMNIINTQLIEIPKVIPANAKSMFFLNGF